MGEVSPNGRGAVPLFNSSLETGLRTLIVLDALYPRACGLSELTWFDHLVVHTSDVDGPESLHPDLPSRGGELLVRRRLVDDGLRLLLNANLVALDDHEDGVRYVAGDEAPSFIDLMTTPYCDRLKNRATWLAERFGSISEEDLRAIIHERLGRWTLEFQGEGTLHEPSA
jgi:hypothetical protein